MSIPKSILIMRRLIKRAQEKDKQLTVTFHTKSYIPRANGKIECLHQRKTTAINDEFISMCKKIAINTEQKWEDILISKLQDAQHDNQSDYFILK